jgi:phage FluMu protein Com
VKLANLKYRDPIYCPRCGKVFGEWKEVRGIATIKKWCPRCKKYVDITKKVDFLKQKSE